MTFRQFMVCLIVGPVCLLFFAAAMCVFPLMALICWLGGDGEPFREAWEILHGQPIEMFVECYRGYDD